MLYLTIRVYHFFQNFEDALSYLNGWENEMNTKKIDPKDFLTITTTQGLRVTIQSTIDLSKYLLEECGFDYVLTGKMCQDPLEVSIYKRMVEECFTIVLVGYC